MFTHPHVVPAPKRIANGNGHANGNLKPVYATAPIHQYPALLIKSVRVVSLLFMPNLEVFTGIHTFFIFQFWTACVVFGPLLWTEVRWWSSNGKSTWTHFLLIALIPIIAFVVVNSGMKIPGLEVLLIR